MTGVSNGKDSTKIVYETSKRYVNEKHPEFGEFFDEIWKLSNSKRQMSSPELKKEIGGLNFVLDSSVTLLITITLPFISGVVSSVLAEIIKQKTVLKPKQTAKIAQDKAEEIRITLNVSKKAADELLPYILSGVAKISSDGGKA